MGLDDIAVSLYIYTATADIYRCKLFSSENKTPQKFRHPSFIGEMWLRLLTVGEIYRWRHLLALMAIILLLCYLTYPKIKLKSSRVP